MTMDYLPLGATGMKVSRYCLGTMMFGFVGNPDHDDCARITAAALDAGINLVDCADMYSAGGAEEIIGKALKGRREDVILATKGHFPLGDDDPNHSGNSRRYLTRALEASLRRLQTDWIDLYQVHRPDPDTDVEETLGFLDDMVRAGTIRAYGCSTFPAHEIVEAWHVARRSGRLPFRTEQPPYSMLARGIERAVLPTCQRLGMGIMTWSPLAFGFLSGRLRRGEDHTRQSARTGIQGKHFAPDHPAYAAKIEATEQLAALAADVGLTLPELAVAFVRSHPAVTSVIVGPRTMDQLESLLAGSEVVLDDATLDRIDAIVPPGTDLAADTTWTPPSLTDPSLRRQRPRAPHNAT